MNIGSSNPLAPSASGKGSFPMSTSGFSKPDFNPLNPLGSGKVTVKRVQNNPLGGVSGSNSNPLGNNSNPLGGNPLGAS